VFNTHVGQIVFHLVMSADDVAENGFRLDGGQTVFAGYATIVGVGRVHALVEITELVQVAPQNARRDFGRRIDNYERR